jgi:asparagine synthase (glutamine-hydrolysing)
MCGICGIHDSSGGGIDRQALDAMNRTLAHRGPDSEGYFEDANVGLAMRRLSIIDVEGGDQPITNEDRSVTVVCNGEIYNYRELTADLRSRGHTFRSGSDVEVIAHLYEEHGVGFVGELRGMFAIALWDAREKRLVLARDGFGIKPLFYATVGDRLMFASELKALLSVSDVPRRMDPQALEAYLTFNFVPGPATILQDVMKLAPGHVLTCDDRGVTVARYARPGANRAGTMRHDSFKTLGAELCDLMRDSVRAHMISDVPVGVLLSGGMDSSLITALAVAESQERLKTFTIGFEEAAYSELDMARLVARRYGTDHHELVVRPDAVELIPRLVGIYDEPFGDSSALPTFLVSELAATQVKVALAGEGADEMFAGYFTYIADSIPAMAGRVAHMARPLIERLPSGTTGPIRLADKAKRFARGTALEPMARHCAWQEVLSADMRDALLDRSANDRPDPLLAHRARFEESVGAEPLTRFQDLDLGTYLVDDILVKSDRASMANSLELRVPYVDRDIADFAFSLPGRHKLRAMQKKRLLREAARPLLPPEVLRAPKRGFSIPAATWLRGDLAPFAREALSASELRRHGLLEPGPVQRMLDDHVAGRADNSRQLWGILMLTVWFEKTMKTAGTPA